MSVDLVVQAREFAMAAHGGQVRKYTGEPYWRHCHAVATTVWNATFDDVATAAAYLHDTIEDTPTTVQQLAEEFGVSVAALVTEVTNVGRPADGNRAARKALDRAHLAQASPLGQTIKVADLIDNASTIMERDPAFAPIYIAEKRALLELLTRGDAGLLKRAWTIVAL